MSNLDDVDLRRIEESWTTERGSVQADVAVLLAEVRRLHGVIDHHLNECGGPEAYHRLAAAR